VVNLFLFVLQRERFVDEHDGDVILDAVDQLAVMANQLILRFAVFQGTSAAWVPYALGTGQNLQKVFAQRHGFSFRFAWRYRMAQEERTARSLSA
jgi:hypothetical protein